MTITFSTCFYIIKSKFEPFIYIQWMNQLLSIVHNFNLVIYTNEETFPYIPEHDNSRVRIIIKPIHTFYNYKYKYYWIRNHENNILLNDRTEWKLNMLWSEKIWFVNETIQKKYFNTDFYGWVDIGYFRNRESDTHTSQLQHWPNDLTISSLKTTKIYYGCINNDTSYMNDLFKLINNKNDVGLPIEPIPINQTSVAGGFFILHKDMIDWWCKTYNDKLELYFKNNCLVKDDQIILIDCILSNMRSFYLYKEDIPYLDNWFMFQRILH